MKTTNGLNGGGEAQAETPTTTAPKRPKPRRPRRITLWVTVPVSEHRRAEQEAKAYAAGGLEEVLAAFVSDWVVALERPGSWEAERVNGWLASHPWQRPEGREF